MLTRDNITSPSRTPLLLIRQTKNNLSKVLISTNELRVGLSWETYVTSQNMAAPTNECKQSVVYVMADPGSRLSRWWFRIGVLARLLKQVITADWFVPNPIFLCRALSRGRQSSAETLSALSMFWWLSNWRICLRSARSRKVNPDTDFERFAAAGLSAPSTSPMSYFARCALQNKRAATESQTEVGSQQ